MTFILIESTDGEQLREFYNLACSEYPDVVRGTLGDCWAMLQTHNSEEAPRFISYDLTADGDLKENNRPPTKLNWLNVLARAPYFPRSKK